MWEIKVKISLFQKQIFTKTKYSYDQTLIFSLFYECKIIYFKKKKNSHDYYIQWKEWTALSYYSRLYSLIQYIGQAHRQFQPPGKRGHLTSRLQSFWCLMKANNWGNSLTNTPCPDPTANEKSTNILQGVWDIHRFQVRCCYYETLANTRQLCPPKFEQKEQITIVC